MEEFIGVPAIPVSVGWGNVSGETVVVIVVCCQWQIHEGRVAGVMA